MYIVNETIEALKENGKTPELVSWVGSKDGKYVMSWKAFEDKCDVKYDNDYGVQQVASDLVVVGRGWWLERYEYDGSEGWAFKTTPRKTHKLLKFSRVGVGQWNTLEELNNDI